MKHVIICLFVFCSLFARAQPTESVGQIDSLNLYYRTLTLHIEYIMTLYEELPTEINVKNSSGLFDNVPEKIKGVSIVYLDDNGILEKVKKEKSIYLIALSPINNKGDVLFINVGDYSVSQGKRKSLHYIYSGSSYFEYRFDCKLNRYIINKIQQGGI